LGFGIRTFFSQSLSPSSQYAVVANVSLADMGIGRGKTEHSGAHNSSAASGHWGTNDEAKMFATAARRRDEREQIRRELHDWMVSGDKLDDVDVDTPE
jgi:hypothetical protein